MVDWWWARAVGSVRSLMDGQARLSVSSRLVFFFFLSMRFTPWPLPGFRLKTTKILICASIINCMIPPIQRSSILFCFLSYHYVRERSAASIFNVNSEGPMCRLTVFAIRMQKKTAFQTGQLQPRSSGLNGNAYTHAVFSTNKERKKERKNKTQSRIQRIHSYTAIVHPRHRLVQNNRAR